MSYDFPKMKADELREVLVKKFNYTDEQLTTIKGKTALVEEIKKLEGIESNPLVEALSNAEEVSEITDSQTGTSDQGPPPRTSPEWHDYVMSQFVKEELIEKNPTVDGLRRVAELLIGDIVESKSKILQVPTEENKGRATVRHRLVVREGSEYITCDGSADVYWANCDKVYRNHPVAVAETRAEGRALRKLLRLRKVLAAEEVAKNLPTISDGSYDQDPTHITDNQIRFYSVMCKKLNINVQKLVNKNHPDVHNINELSYDESLSLQELVTSYSNESEAIPEDIVGYDSNWETVFRSQS